MQWDNLFTSFNNITFMAFTLQNKTKTHITLFA
jgi:hypothetical protein